jgi:hypothetical protein
MNYFMKPALNNLIIQNFEHKMLKQPVVNSFRVFLALHFSDFPIFNFHLFSVIFFYCLFGCLHFGGKLDFVYKTFQLPYFVIRP